MGQLLLYTALSTVIMLTAHKMENSCNNIEEINKPGSANYLFIMP